MLLKVEEKGMGLRNFNLSGLLCVSEFFPPWVLFPLLVKLHLNNSRRLLEAKKKRSGLFSEVFSLLCTRVFLSVWHLDMAVCFLNYTCLPSHARVVLTVGTLAGFRLMFGSAATAAQERRDRKIEEGIGSRFSWKIQQGQTNTAFFFPPVFSNCI